MATDDDEKLYETYAIEWDSYEEEYSRGDGLTREGKPIQFDTYAEFLTFMDSLSEEDKLDLGLWRLENTYTGHYVTISDGIFDDVTYLSIGAKNEK